MRLALPSIYGPARAALSLPCAKSQNTWHHLVASEAGCRHAGARLERWGQNTAGAAGAPQPPHATRASRPQLTAGPPHATKASRPQLAAGPPHATRASRPRLAVW